MLGMSAAVQSPDVFGGKAVCLSRAFTWLFSCLVCQAQKQLKALYRECRQMPVLKKSNQTLDAS